ncbi:MAG: hypothetical protein KME52_28410 [Desmonostoc geniculatum HA4340-LM1]|jgi:hypothetical protein|nr:hypothetical protein [Desmonostoc geniculatum HA4340-LM1]
MEYEFIFDFTKNHEILAPIVRLSEYCNWLNVTYRGKFRLPAKYYKNESNHVFIAFILLITIFYEKEAYKRFGYLILLEKIVKNDFEITLKIYSLFPAFLKTIDNKIDFEKELIIKNNYQGIGYWLNAWDKKIDTYELKNSCVGWLEKFALTKQRKYDLVRELHSRRYISEILPGHNSTWLLSEFSIFLHSIECYRENVNQIYLAFKKHLDNLDDFAKKPDRYIANDLFRDFDGYIDTVARDAAELDPDFDKNYFRVYLSAQRSENAYAKNNKLQLVNLKHKTSSKRGRKLGQKTRQY